MASLNAYISVNSSLTNKSTSCSVGFLLLLSNSLGLILIINALLSDGEFLLDVFESGDWAIVPWMSLHFSQCNSLGWVEL